MVKPREGREGLESPTSLLETVMLGQSSGCQCSLPIPQPRTPQERPKVCSLTEKGLSSGRSRGGKQGPFRAKLAAELRKKDQGAGCRARN